MDKLNITLTYQGGRFYTSSLNDERISKEKLFEIMGMKLPCGNITKECENWIKSQKEYEVNYFDEFDIS